MRRVRKTRPPANVSPEGQAACSLQEKAHRFLQELEKAPNRSSHARATFDSLHKAKLRDVLLREQHHLCIYCECRVEDDSRHPIEHWRPLGAEPEHALNWKNLYLSCPTKETCDGAKDCSRLAVSEEAEQLPWPTDIDYERCVDFTSGGKVFVRPDSPLTHDQRSALNLAISSILKLNAPRLVAARKGAIDSEKSSIDSDFNDRKVPTEALSVRVNSLLDEKNEKHLPYVSARVAYLQKKIESRQGKA
ncbi:MAG: TIGR02646 family protein [Myxococcales bacterium]|jgi:uncharacterized protein (TIGR02646 family)|nr:TIGR02646 family protein [Myxococcales bacterium]